MPHDPWFTTRGTAPAETTSPEIESSGSLSAKPEAVNLRAIITNLHGSPCSSGHATTYSDPVQATLGYKFDCGATVITSPIMRPSEASRAAEMPGNGMCTQATT